MTDPIRAEITDAADPQDEGRVRVRAAAMGAQWEAWAQVLRADPTVTPAYAPGDIVMILFEGGDSASPIVLGALSSRGGAALTSELPETDHDWDDLVLPAEVRDQLRRLAAAANGARALFSGPSGTGKTMAAQIIAKDLGRQVFSVDLARVVSKYIGETEKNLAAIFDAAEAGGAILFFDEADALFGKRSEVKDSHDRYANVEIDYLLQRMEEFPGLAILATNRAQNIDAAFTRRLTQVVDFAPPDAADRRQIWRRALGALPPERVAEMNVDAIADQHALTGGQIMRALRDACIGALGGAAAVEESDIREAIARLRG